MGESGSPRLRARDMLKKSDKPEMVVNIVLCNELLFHFYTDYSTLFECRRVHWFIDISIVVQIPVVMVDIV